MEHVTTLFATLRRVERTARARLIAGCADDAAKIERLFERPLSAARRDAHDAMAASAGVSADFALKLRREAFERIGVTCAEKVRANVALRARARFRIYTSELAQAEAAISDAIAASALVAAKRILPRMFTVGRIDVGELQAPDPPERESEIDGWVEALHGCIRDGIGGSVKAARDRVLSHGFDRLAIVKARIELALREPNRGRPYHAVEGVLSREPNTRR